MGRIKTQLIKRTTKKLIEKYIEEFSEEYEHNKKAVQKILPDANKKMRNIIAGYCVRLMQQHNKIKV